jgi:hypothetical protein
MGFTQTDQPSFDVETENSHPSLIVEQSDSDRERASASSTAESTVSMSVVAQLASNKATRIKSAAFIGLTLELSRPATRESGADTTPPTRHLNEAAMRVRLE